MIRRIFAVCLPPAFAAVAHSALAAGSFTVGMMNDQSGACADLAGPGLDIARRRYGERGGRACRQRATKSS